MINFEEKHVPVEIRGYGIVRSFKPDNGRDYRLLLDDKGNWSTFPRTKLDDDEKTAIVLLALETGHPFTESPKAFGRRLAEEWGDAIREIIRAFLP